MKRCRDSGVYLDLDNNSPGESEKLPTFSFPSDPERSEVWIENIPRSGDFIPDSKFEPSKHSAVCAKHLCVPFIVRDDSLTHADGTIELKELD